jgi:hypothetical protein
MITYEQAGIPVELLDERDWRRAIASRRLTRGTQVVAYRGPTCIRRVPAEDVPELQSIFNELDPPVRATPVAAVSPPRSPEVPDAPSQRWDHLEPDRAQGEAWDRGRDEDPAEYEDTTDYEDATEYEEEHDFLGSAAQDAEKDDAPATSLLALLAPILFLLGIILTLVVISARSNDAEVETGAALAAQAYRVSEPANAREVPATSGRRVRTLRPGTVLIGVAETDAVGRTWVRIAEGENAGLFVWTGNLESIGAADSAIDPIR